MHEPIPARVIHHGFLNQGDCVVILYRTVSVEKLGVFLIQEQIREPVQMLDEGATNYLRCVCLYPDKGDTFEFPLKSSIPLYQLTVLEIGLPGERQICKTLSYFLNHQGEILEILNKAKL